MTVQLSADYKSDNVFCCTHTDSCNCFAAVQLLNLLNYSQLTYICYINLIHSIVPLSKFSPRFRTWLLLGNVGQVAQTHPLCHLTFTSVIVSQVPYAFPSFFRWRCCSWSAWVDPLRPVCSSGLPPSPPLTSCGILWPSWCCWAGSLCMPSSIWRH